MSATGPDQTVRRPMLSPPDQYSLLSGDATRLEDSLHTVLSHTLLFKESFPAESRRRGALMIGSWFYVHRISLSAKVGIKTVKKTCSLIFFSAFKICFCTLYSYLPHISTNTALNCSSQKELPVKSVFFQNQLKM